MNKNWPHAGKTKWGRKRRKPRLISEYKEDYKPLKKGGETMNRFWDLLAKSTIFQGIITLLLLVTMCYLWATGQAVPDSLVQSSTLVLGFFFGAKVQQSVTTYNEKREG